MRVKPRKVLRVTDRRRKETGPKKMKHCAGKVYRVACNPMTSTDGYWDNRTPAVLHISSGDVVEIETGTHLARRMRQGTEIRQWVKWYKELREREPATFLYADRATGTDQLLKGPNHATLTGPIYINEAEPGDILE